MLEKNSQQAKKQQMRIDDLNAKLAESSRSAAHSEQHWLAM